MKKCLITVVSVVAALALNADVMKWQVNDSGLSGYNGARLMYSDSNTTTPTTPNAPLAETDLVNGRGDIVQIDLAQAIGSTANSMYYYIEVGNFNGDIFTASKVMGAYSYDQLVSAGLIAPNAMNPPSGKMFGDTTVSIAGSPSAYGNVPEPGTATLILLGMAIAGLKRRRV